MCSLIEQFRGVVNADDHISWAGVVHQTEKRNVHFGTQVKKQHLCAFYVTLRDQLPWCWCSVKTPSYLFIVKVLCSLSYLICVSLQLPVCLLRSWLRATSWRATSLSCVETWIQMVGLSGKALSQQQLHGVSWWGCLSLCSFYVTVCRCSQLELSGCALREVCFSIQRDGVPQDTPFTCRVGEIMVRQLFP